MSSASGYQSDATNYQYQQNQRNRNQSQNQQRNDRHRTDQTSRFSIASDLEDDSRSPLSRRDRAVGSNNNNRGYENPCNNNNNAQSGAGQGLMDSDEQIPNQNH